MNTNLKIIISGPVGAGKSSMIANNCKIAILLKRFPKDTIKKQTPKLFQAVVCKIKTKPFCHTQIAVVSNMINGKKTILLAGMSQSEQNSLAVLLPKRVNGGAVLLRNTTEHATPQPDVVLISLRKTKNPSGVLKNIKNAYPGTPVVCISNKPTPAASVSLSPPIGIEKLASAINSALHSIEKQKINRVKPKKQEPLATFNTEERLLGGLLQARALQRETGLAVEFQAKDLISYLILPDDKVLSTICRQTLKSLCRVRFDSHLFKTTTIKASALDHLIAEHYNQANEWLLEDFFWHVGYWSSQGAIPDKIDKRQPLHLHKWPNVTRIPQPLLIIAISALLNKQPTSAHGITKKLGISEKSATQCISGMFAAENIEQYKIRKPGAPLQTVASQHTRNILKKLAHRLLAPWHRQTKQST